MRFFPHFILPPPPSLPELLKSNWFSTVSKCAIFSVEFQELDFNHRRLKNIKNLENLKCIERLYLRWNLLKKIENVSTLTTLRELELYDNQITEIENLDCLVNLEYVLVIAAEVYTILCECVLCLLFNCDVNCGFASGFWICHSTDLLAFVDWKILSNWKNFFCATTKFKKLKT